MQCDIAAAVGGDCSGSCALIRAVARLWIACRRRRGRCHAGQILVGISDCRLVVAALIETPRHLFPLGGALDHGDLRRALARAPYRLAVRERLRAVPLRRGGAWRQFLRPRRRQRHRLPGRIVRRRRGPRDHRLGPGAAARGNPCRHGLAGGWQSPAGGGRVLGAAFVAGRRRAGQRHCDYVAVVDVVLALLPLLLLSPPAIKSRASIPAAFWSAPSFCRWSC